MAEMVYKTVSFIFANHGLCARYAEDRLPDQLQYLNLANLECRQENALSSRYGLQSITNDGTISTPLPAGVHSLGRMKGLFGVTDRLAGAATKIYDRNNDSNGAYTDISGAFVLSGNPWSQVVYTPEQAASPYSYIFDSAANVKYYRGAAAVLQTGINPPTIPCLPTIATGVEQIVIIDGFFDNGGGLNPFHTNNITGVSLSSKFATITTAAITSPGYQAVPVVTVAGINVGDLTINGYFQVGNISGNSISGYYPATAPLGTVISNSYLAGAIASSTVAYVGRYMGQSNISNPTTDLTSFNGIEEAETDVFHLAFFVDVPANIIGFGLLIAVGPNAQVIGSFTDYYIFPFFSEVASLVTGWNYLTCYRSDFTAIGRAGNPGYTWSNCSAYQISVDTGGGSVNVGFDNLYVSVGSQLDVTGGIPYNYRFTYYNQNTGTESNPCVVATSTNEVNVVNGSVSIYFGDTPPAEATHRILYRQGGSLSAAWYEVAEIPVAQTSYLDSWPDSQIVNNNQLAVDNDPPVTSTLVTPINIQGQGSYAQNTVATIFMTPATQVVPGQLLTLDTGAAQEEVYVITGGTASFTAFVQNQRPGLDFFSISASTTPAMGVNLACVAFDTVWVAGDPNNPSTLYYSKRFNPEAYPPENTLIVGPPSDPIMGIIFYRGQLYVWTLTTIYQIIAAGQPVPFAIITGSIHGLYANFGGASAESEFIYEGIDGIYAFSGASILISKIIDWILQGQTLGPVIPMNQSLRQNVKAAFCANDVFFSYTGTDSNIHRIVWSTTYKRWRNDDVPALSMLYEADTGNLVVGEASGNIYLDRTGDFDDGGWAGGIETKTPIQINLQAQLIDFGNQYSDKVIQELTMDVDTAGQNLTVTFYYNNLNSTFTDTFTVNTASRKQVHFNVNNGLGYKARRLGVKVTGAVTSAITLYQWDIRVMLDAESRQSFDTGQMDLGTSEFKIVKQGWFEYEAPNGPVTVSCYLEGSDTVAYSFTLPQTIPISNTVTNTLGTASVKIRFPAEKARIWRFVGTCAGDFKLYNSSFFEWKSICSEKGYQKHALVESSAV